MEVKPRALGAPATLAACALLAACGGAAPRSSEQAGKEASSEQKAEADTAAFARCLREHGVNAETPHTGNGRAAPVRIHVSGAGNENPALQTAQTKCRKFQPDAGPLSGPPPDAQTLDKLVMIARCMRAHGISEFPDPTTARPSLSSLSPGKYREITNYDGAILLFPRTIDMEAPAYRRDLAACGAPPLGLPH